MRNKSKSQSQVFPNATLENIHEITYDNYFTKQGVEAFEKGLNNLRSKKLDIEKNQKKSKEIVINFKISI